MPASIGDFIQTNVSRSAKGVLRGLHYQWPNPQGKLVSVLEGEVYDVAVDIRQGSPNFGQWIRGDADCRQPSSFLDTGRLCARVLRAV
jgi:dTDP-4-dehydrorhamnose 3,5-epimerase